jgi:hypothetical protein
MAMLAPLSRSEKHHADSWLIGLTHDGRISSLVELYPIISALGFEPHNKADRTSGAAKGCDATPLSCTEWRGAFRGSNEDHRHFCA